MTRSHKTESLSNGARAVLANRECRFTGKPLSVCLCKRCIAYRDRLTTESDSE